jgi:hypothetical protein
MKIRSNAGNRLLLCAISAVGLAAVQWPHPAEAFHVQGITIVPVSKDSVTRTVVIDVIEQTVGTGSVHSQANVAWGDAMNSNHAWTSTTGAGPKFYHVNGVSHVYPDLTTRVITVQSDCCNTTLGYDFDTQVVDFGCSDTPMFLCNNGAVKAQLQIKNNADDSKDKLKFKWLNGNTTFDDPTSTNDYFFCVYAPTLVMESIIPHGAPWSATGSGFKYTENTGAAGGIQKIKLKNGAGNAKLLVKGAGTNLSDPAMPLTQPVLVQVQSSLGSCWGHQFTSPEIENSADAFKDKEP